MIAKAAAQMSTAAEQNVGAALKGISQSIQKVLKQSNRSEPVRIGLMTIDFAHEPYA